MKRKISWDTLFFIALSVSHFLIYKFWNLPFSLSRDQTMYTFPALSAIRNRLLAGEFPFWFSESYLGEPLFTLGSIDLKSLLLLPFLEPLDTMVLLTSIYLLVGASGCSLLLKRLFGFSPLARIVGSVVFILNGFLVWYYYDTPFSPIVLWVPWQVLWLVQFKEKPAKYFSFLTLSIADQMHTGRFETIELAFGALFLFLFVVSLPLEKSSPKASLRSAVRKTLFYIPVFGLALALALLIIMPIFYDHLSAIVHSRRYASDTPGLLYPSSILNFFTMVPDAKALLGRSPGVDHRSYLGFSMLFVILTGLLFSKNRRRAWAFFIAAVVLQLFLLDTKILGINLFNDLYKKLPRHEGIRYSIRFLPFVFLFLAVGVAEGVDTIRAATSRKKFLILGTPFLILIGWLAYQLSTKTTPTGSYWDKPTIVFILLGCNALLIALLALPGRFVKAGLLLVALFHVWSSYAVNGMMGGMPLSFFNWVYRNEAFRAYFPFFEQFPRHEFRVLPALRDTDVITPLNSTSNIESVGGYYMLTNAAKYSFMSKVLRGTVRGYYDVNIKDMETRGYDLANVKYWLVESKENYDRRKYMESALTMKKIAHIPGRELDVYESLTALPRTYLATQAEWVRPEEADDKIINRLNTHAAWFKQGTMLVGNNDFPLPDSKKSGEVKIQNYRNNEITLSVHAPDGGVVVLSEAFDNRWLAKLNGKNTPWVRANGIFAGVPVPPGEHLLVFKYVIPAWQWISSVVGIVLLLVFAIARQVGFAPARRGNYGGSNRT